MGVHMSDEFFDRPVFIVNPPRSGSTFLFEILTQAPHLFTIGGESHNVIEGVPALAAAARGWESNRLTADDATPATTAALRSRFGHLLRDRHGAAPISWPVRMLEKTPKNSLRISFLAKVFPEARFIYLYRDPRQVLASMMEGWESGRFRTYPGLPAWNGVLPWSFLLTPGWRDLRNLPLNQIVAAQWAASTRILLDDLAQIPAERRTVAHYGRLVAEPETEVRRLCACVQLEWDRSLRSDLPVSVYTVSPPDPDKWRARETEIKQVLPSLRDLLARLERMGLA